jgi:hypothetical protein
VRWSEVKLGEVSLARGVKCTVKCSAGRQPNCSQQNTVRSESQCALRFGCQYRSCRCSVLLFHCIQLLNSGCNAIPVRCVIVVVFTHYDFFN